MKRVPFPIIQAAKEFDTEAVEFVFRHFEGFIASQCLINCYEGAPRQVAKAPKKRSGYCAIRQGSKESSGGIYRESEGTDSGLSHTVIRGLDTNRLMTTP